MSFMSDFIWSLMVCVLLAASGLGMVWLGLAIWKKQRIDLIIRHHMDKVSDQNKPAYCRLCGIGVLISGAGFAVSGIAVLFSMNLLSWLPLAAGLVVGLFLITLSGIRYNH